MPGTQTSTKFRTDIQALRGVAVLLVVLYHGKLLPLQAGYLGVDIFFVISGFLITRLIKEGIDRGNFSFAEFYYRRAKRLLPAAYVTFFLTAVATWGFLDSRELRDFARQLVGAITFTCNFVLARQSGYFEGASNLKPFLHVWSLSLEEQYYLLVPAVLFFTPRRYWVLGAAAVVATSLGLCLVLTHTSPVAAFYLLPTRAWELALGSLGALVHSKNDRWSAVSSHSLWPAVLALLLIPIAPLGTTHPGLDAVIVCVATLIIILARHRTLNSHPLSRGLAKVGDFSYSLYLVHWPIFAFLNNAYVGQQSVAVHAAAVMAALLLGYCTYRYVELPFRHARVQLSMRAIGATVLVSLAIGLLPFAMIRAQTASKDYADVRRPNFGFGPECEFSGAFLARSGCRNSERPQILVWGDSFAMHLVPGIAATADGGVAQATQSACGPLIDLAPTNAGTHSRNWAENCLQFNQSVLAYLAATPSIRTVVLASTFDQYLNAPLDAQLWGSDRPFRVVQKIGDKLIEDEASSTAALRAIQKTVEMVKALDKRVVIIAPPPRSGFDIGRCLERRATGKLVLGADSQCQIDVAVYRQHQKHVLELLGQLEQRGVTVLYFDKALCSETACATEAEGTFLYRDAGHFSYDGSRFAARRLGLGKLLTSSAHEPGMAP